MKRFVTTAITMLISGSVYAQDALISHWSIECPKIEGMHTFVVPKIDGQTPFRPNQKMVVWCDEKGEAHIDFLN